VAGAAFNNVLMIIGHGRPFDRIGVAHDTCAGIVVIWVIFLVTGATFKDAYVIELKRYPVVHLMAIGAFTSEMIGIEIVGIERHGIGIVGIERHDVEMFGSP
jgi:hypothetical protein